MNTLENRVQTLGNENEDTEADKQESSTNPLLGFLENHEIGNASDAQKPQDNQEEKVHNH
ncbi:hypothetical protein A2U01_0070685, partial [Trifolium medium]|nr:hypothetical protein [Trifolium medium]